MTLSVGIVDLLPYTNPMKYIILICLLSSYALAEETNGEKFKKTVNTAATNIDAEARKVVKKGKEVWNDNVKTPPPKKKVLKD